MFCSKLLGLMGMQKTPVRGLSSRLLIWWTICLVMACAKRITRTFWRMTLPSDVIIFPILRNNLTLHTDSAVGPNYIHPQLMKECSEQLAYPYYLLFKKFIFAGCLPLPWKHSKVIPSYEKGSRSDSLNFQPLSLTPFPCKILEHIITKPWSMVMVFLVYQSMW